MFLSLKQLKNFIPIVNRPQSIQRDELVSTCWQCPMVSLHCEEDNRDLYFDTVILEKRFRYLIKKIANPTGWHRHLRAYKKLQARSINGSRLSAREISKISNSSLARIFIKDCEFFKADGDYILFPFAIEKYLDGECRQLLVAVYGEVDRLFALISAPTKMICFQKMQAEVYRAVLNKDKTAVKRLVRRYHWLPFYNYLDKPFDENYFKREIRKISPAESRQNLKKMKAELACNRRAFVSFRRRVKNQRLALLIDIINTYVYLRSDRLDIIRRIQSKRQRMFKEIADRLNLIDDRSWSAKDLVFWLDQEIIDFLQHGTIPNWKEIKRRTSQRYVYYRGVKSAVTTDQVEINWIKKGLQSRKEKKEVKGLAVYPGLIRGRVKLVLVKTDLEKVKNGDILVARTTMPDYIAGMRKAAAFITDEGGVTCHAAVTARELKKPCIVGTGTATKVFQSGDLVEIDAGRGTVKIRK